MKVVAGIFFALVCLLALSWVSLPLMWLDISDLQLEMGVDLGWVGFEILALLLAIVALVVIVALLSAGILGLLLIVFIGLVMTLLFNSLIVLFPLICIIAIVWLVVDKSAQAQA
ncbi:hypothetical protein HUZ36_13770 [Pseudoalteromonas sp. McH1-7]|uniref:hypothetical protein n=1 Tax=Pseudoalteromonas TaxID=53246 RepID=UPI000F64BA1D|nr:MULTISPECIES: hypothetical protein [Pseudoalteromonas]MDW7550434.1 hypothetical protein [Pseudoalteromonas peptidolytica]NUZ11850.1 hypothetical protein [Pseudoalteromonas sp. McH1-7]RRS09887.1 hypothetical protein EAG18_04175 [Pseudoalteromonas sp. J010]RXF01750.1 hypothetical protein D9603_12730 [Pseudoalteromonas sp. PS5]USD28232.1 hypothetical protein J8Z24_15150 [Pseudoalteromonas sp. SCSIO 43201]